MVQLTIRGKYLQPPRIDESSEHATRAEAIETATRILSLPIATGPMVYGVTLLYHDVGEVKPCIGALRGVDDAPVAVRRVEGDAPLRRRR